MNSAQKTSTYESVLCFSIVTLTSYLSYICNIFKNLLIETIIQCYLSIIYKYSGNMLLRMCTGANWIPRGT